MLQHRWFVSVVVTWRKTVLLCVTWPFGVPCLSARTPASVDIGQKSPSYIQEFHNSELLMSCHGFECLGLDGSEGKWLKWTRMSDILGKPCTVLALCTASSTEFCFVLFFWLSYWTWSLNIHHLLYCSLKVWWHFMIKRYIGHIRYPKEKSTWIFVGRFYHSPRRFVHKLLCNTDRLDHSLVGSLSYYRDWEKQSQIHLYCHNTQYSRLFWFAVPLHCSWGRLVCSHKHIIMVEISFDTLLMEPYMCDFGDRRL